MQIQPDDDETRAHRTPYHIIGGEKTVDRLVETFYSLVAKHPELAPIFPDDLTPVAEKQKAFLTQFFGGPPLFSQQYGHPMLRARHLPHPITPKGTAAWLDCMSQAMDAAEITGPVREFLFEHLTRTAHHMINTDD